MSTALRENQIVRLEGLIVNYLCLCSSQLELTSTDDVGTKFFKCPTCSKTFSFAKTEEMKKYEQEQKDLRREATLEEITEILDLTIKLDEDIKSLVFLTFLTAYTKNEQVNVIVSGESSIGKTYVVSEVSKFFPNEDLIKKHGVSPTAFFYDDNRVLVDKTTLEKFTLVQPSPDASQEEKHAYREQKKNTAFLQDFERKIIVLPDMPDVKVLEKLRPVLSHDDRICVYSNTTPNPYGMRAKDVYVRGFGIFVVCTCTPYLDEQETSRTFQINPQWTPEKEKAVLGLINKRNSSPKFNTELESNPQRIWLKKRIELIKDTEINEIFINEELLTDIYKWFEGKRESSTPKSSREYTRLLSLAKAWCLFNLWNREKDENLNLYCTQTDIEVAKKVYASIVESSAYNLSPEEYAFFKHLEEIYKGTSTGFKVSEAHQIYYNKNKRPCSDKRLRNMLESFCREGLMRKDKQGQTFYYYIQEHKSQENQQELLSMSP